MVFDTILLMGSFSRDHSGGDCVIYPASILEYRMCQNLSSHKVMNLDLGIMV